MIARCNNTNCQAKFEIDDLPYGGFCGSAAARIEEFATCPECGMMDCHWVYAIDIMPAFEVEVPAYIKTEDAKRYIATKTQKIINEWALSH